MRAIEEFPALSQPHEAVNALRGLAEGWDGRHAQPVTGAAVVAALTIASRLVDGHSLEPQIYTLPDGGLQLEWHVLGTDVEIEVDGSGAPFGAATDAAGRTLWEREFGADDESALADLGRLIAEMAHDLKSAGPLVCHGAAEAPSREPRRG